MRKTDSMGAGGKADVAAGGAPEARAAALLLGGEWRTGAGEPLRSVNPANGLVHAATSTPDRGEVDEAVRRAAEAQRAALATCAPTSGRAC